MLVRNIKEKRWEYEQENSSLKGAIKNSFQRKMVMSSYS